MKDLSNGEKQKPGAVTVRKAPPSSSSSPLQESLQCEPRKAICMENPLGAACVGPHAGRGGASGNHLGRATNVNQVGGDSDWGLPVPAPASAFAYWERAGPNKGKVASVSTSIWEEAGPPALTLEPHDSVPLQLSLMLLEQLPLSWSSE